MTSRRRQRGDDRPEVSRASSTLRATCRSSTPRRTRSAGEQVQAGGPAEVAHRGRAALAHLDHARRLHALEGLAHRGPGHAEHAGQPALARERLAVEEVAGDHALQDLVDDLAGHEAAFDGVQCGWHAPDSSTGRWSDVKWSDQLVWTSGGRERPGWAMARGGGHPEHDRVRTRTKRVLLTLTSALAVSLPLGLTVTAADAAPRADDPSLAQAAALNGLSEGRLSEILATDSTAQARQGGTALLRRPRAGRGVGERGDRDRGGAVPPGPDVPAAQQAGVGPDDLPRLQRHRRHQHGVEQRLVSAAQRLLPGASASTATTPRSTTPSAS